MFERSQLAKYSLDDWVNEFHEIYGDVNDYYHTSADIWLHVVEHAARIHEDLRTSNYGDVFVHLPRVFCWLCAFVKRASTQSTTLQLNPSFEAIILRKFPRWCFYCQKSPCECAGGPHMQDLEEKARNKKLLRAAAHHRHTELLAAGEAPHTLPSFVKMFQDMFGHKNFDQPDVIIAAHFQEEIGEICEVMNRMYDLQKVMGQSPDEMLELRLDLEDEIADAFSWMVALYTKVDYILGGARQYLTPEVTPRAGSPWLGKTFEELVWDSYVKHDDFMADPTSGMRPVKPSGTPLSAAESDS